MLPIEYVRIISERGGKWNGGIFVSLCQHRLEGGVQQTRVEADPGVHEHSPSGRLPAREGRLHEGQQVRRGQGRPNLKDEED